MDNLWTAGTSHIRYLLGLVSATTFLVLGSFTKVIVVLWGMAVFHDAASPLAILGATLSIGGSVWYSYVRDYLSEMISPR
jgi:solute carrier family 35 protein